MNEIQNLFGDMHQKSYHVHMTRFKTVGSETHV